MKNINYFILLLAVVSIVSSCKKKDEETPSPVPVGIATGTFYLHLHTNIDTSEVVAGSIAVDTSGRHFQLDIAQFYMSGIKLKKADGTFYSVSNRIILKNIAEEMYLIAEVPVGNYTGISFNVGLDSATNQTNPSAYAATDILSPQDPSMWFGSTVQGFMFMNVQGLADTSTANNGSVNYPFSYQLGTKDLVRNVSSAVNPFTIRSGQSTMMHCIADYAVLLQGVSFKSQNSVTPFNNLGVATQIANNIPFMFHWEE